jgi:hypothetical protein
MVVTAPVLPGPGALHGVHPSLAALLCWRYFQLLTVLPKRGTEAEAWRQLAQGHWAAAGYLSGMDIQEVLGGANRLKGPEQQGEALMVSMLSMRLLLV